MLDFCFPKKKKKKLKTRILVSIHACGIGNFNNHKCLLFKNSSFIRKILVFYKNSEHISKAKLLRQENMRIKDQPAQSPGPKHGCRKSCCCCFSTGTLQGNECSRANPSIIQLRCLKSNLNT